MKVKELIRRLEEAQEWARSRGKEDDLEVVLGETSGMLVGRLDVNVDEHWDDYVCVVQGYVRRLRRPEIREADMRIEAKQRDAEYKMRASLHGGHYHCAFFSRYRGQATWAKIGDLVVAEDEIASFVESMGGVEVEFAEVAQG